MVHIPVEAYLQVLFYHPNQLHPCIHKATNKKVHDVCIMQLDKHAITLSYILVEFSLTKAENSTLKLSN